MLPKMGHVGARMLTRTHVLSLVQDQKTKKEFPYKESLEEDIGSARGKRKENERKRNPLQRG
jgi:hypothetical protein